MNIEQVMKREIHVASPEDTLHQAAQIMEAENFDMLPVGENDRLVGMVSDRDITVRAVARGLSPDDCKVREVGVKEEMLDRIAQESMHDRWIHTNPRKIAGPEVVRQLLDAAW